MQPDELDQWRWELAYSAYSEAGVLRVFEEHERLVREDVRPYKSDGPLETIEGFETGNTVAPNTSLKADDRQVPKPLGTFCKACGMQAPAKLSGDCNRPECEYRQKPEKAEPVAWLLKCSGEIDELAWDGEPRLTQADIDYGWIETPLYTQPQPAVPIEVVEALEFYAQCSLIGIDKEGGAKARIALAKLKGQWV